MNKIRKIFAILLCITTIVGICSCKKNDLGLIKGKSKIALITGVQELELDFLNEEVWQGIVAFGDANEVEYTYYTPTEATVDKIYSTFELAVDEGADVLVCMGPMFSGAIAKMQQNYDDIKIIAIDVAEASIGTLAKNTHCVSFKQNQSGYLAGYAAVKDGFTKLGFFGEYDIERYSGYGYGFFNGAVDAAKEDNVKIEFDFAFGNEFDSVEQGIEAVDGWYKNGCEVVLAAGTENTVSAIAKSAVENFAYVMGTSIDQSYLGQSFDYNPFMVSAMKGLREAVNTTLERAATKQWEEELSGKTNFFGLENGNYLYLNEDQWLWLFEQFTLDEYWALKEEISSGAVSIERTKFVEFDQENIVLRKQINN